MVVFYYLKMFIEILSLKYLFISKDVIVLIVVRLNIIKVLLSLKEIVRIVQSVVYKKSFSNLQI